MDFFTDDTNVWVGQNLGHDVLTLSHIHSIEASGKEFFKNTHLSIWLCWVLVVVLGISSFGMLDVVP